MGLGLLSWGLEEGDLLGVVLAGDGEGEDQQDCAGNGASDTVTGLPLLPTTVTVVDVLIRLLLASVIVVVVEPLGLLMVVVVLSNWPLGFLKMVDVDPSALTVNVVTLPFPATVLMVPPGVTLRTRLLVVSAM